MIRFETGNLLAARVEAMVNTVNTVGVMGKGIALQFKMNFPDNFRAYVAACEREEVEIGKMFVTKTNRMDGLQYIINFPTKKHWKQPSKLEYIQAGLIDLKRILLENNIGSIALPPLGCGNGGLDWAVVKPLIQDALGNLPVSVIVFEPSEAVKKVLDAENSRQEVKLTPARAMMLSLLYHYRGLGEYASEFAAEKLMYFLQRMGETQLKLDFQKHYYGPYSGKVRHVLHALNGAYLSEFSQKDARPFQPLPLRMERQPEVFAFLHENTGPAEQERLARVQALLEGFQSPAGLELLATLDYLIEEHKTFDYALIFSMLKNWSVRKKGMFSEYQVQVALKRLIEFRDVLYPTL